MKSAMTGPSYLTFLLLGVVLTGGNTAPTSTVTGGKSATLAYVTATSFLPAASNATEVVT